ncbi:MAG: family 78 glycoside hydrolase catalytic domain, partial [Leadbetterella sp.]
MKINFKLLYSALFMYTHVCMAQVPVNLKFEYQRNPIGVDKQNPRLSWQIKSDARGTKQTAYQILVASSEANLKKDIGDVWSSGKVMSDKNIFIAYKGKPFVSRQKCFWKVKVWNQKAKPSIWSEIATWEMGLLQKSDWSAHWIGKKGTEGRPPKAIDFQKEFKLNKRPVRAVVYVCGLGAYTVSFNGKKIGNDILAPGWTHYPKTIHYQTYEIDSESLMSGVSFISGSVGSGWWSSGLGWEKADAHYSQGPNRLLFQMEFTYYDGTIDRVVSDQSWEVRNSAIVENSIYGGEVYDGRLEYSKEWVKADLLDDATNKTSLFPNAMMGGGEKEVVFSTENAILKANPTGGIKVQQELKAIAMTEPKKGHYVYDFGQNMVGYVQVTAEGNAGKKIELKFSELIDSKGMVDQANLRAIRPKDTYILKGYGKEVWEPKFTFHGYRYVELTGYPGKPNINTLVAKVIHSPIDKKGTFTCSNPLLNKIYSNIDWSQRSNLVGVPTDCPQRDERMGWMGDAQIFAPTAIYNRDMNGIFIKWLQDIQDGQGENGAVTDVNPKVLMGGVGKPAWADAMVIIPYRLWEYYGDDRAIQDNYEAMKKYVDFLNNDKTTKANGIYHFEAGSGDNIFYGFGDWVPVEKSPTKPIGGAYQVFSNYLLSQMAGAIGQVEDQKKYVKISTEVAKKYNELYLDKGSKNYEGATQGANLIPLNLGVTSESDKTQVVANIIENVKAKNDHLTTGFLSTQMLLPTLSENGAHELAYKVATQKTYPGWGYMIEKGATTMWELWNSDTEKP